MLKKTLPYIGAFILGSLMALAMAPASLWPALFICLSGFYILLTKSSSPKQAFLQGWLFGFGYSVFGLYWIGNALLVDGNPYAWAWPLAVAGLPIVLAVYTGLAAFIIKRFMALNHISGLFGFAGILALSEWLRGHLFTGFPWNLYGYAWADFLPMVQVAALGGIYGLTLLTILWAATPGFLYISGSTKRCKIILFFCMAASLVSCLAYGVSRLQRHPSQMHESISIRIVQPNIPQADKWDRDKIVDHFYTHVELSKPENPDQTTYVIWPETALHPWLASDASSMRALQSQLGPNGYLLAGTLIYNGTTEKYSNRISLIDHQGTILQSYDKSHLVPFGEYIPFQDFIPLAPITGFSGLNRGSGLQNQNTPEGLAYSPLICYEIIFPGAVIPKKEPRPDFIVNVSNDAWYGKSAGPYQHFTHAIFRAVEEGVPVIRSANTGLSGMVDPLGRTVTLSTLFEKTTLDENLPKKIKALPLFMRVKTFLFFLFAITFVGFGMGSKCTICKP